jgi:hypothetical protein
MKYYLFTLLPFAFLFSAAQSNDYQLTAPDSTFTIHIARIKAQVVITLSFHKEVDCDYVAIERKADNDNSFHQCKYIDRDELQSGKEHFTCTDIYPPPATSDVLYRLKIAYANDAMRTYPPVRLPAVNGCNECSAIGGH